MNLPKKAQISNLSVAAGRGGSLLKSPSTKPPVRKHILDLDDFSHQEIEDIIQNTDTMREVLHRDIKKVPTLRGKSIITLFFEPSTRTKTTFELASKKLSADFINIDVANSSANKGESVLDMIKTLEAMNCDMFIVRHSVSGTPHYIAQEVGDNIAVINAGDGSHAHPTQAMLDMYTIKKSKGGFQNLNISIVGDILHSRVALSNIFGLVKLGAKVKVCGPPHLIPKNIETLNIEKTYNVDELIEWADVLNILRIQRERMGVGIIPSIREYRNFFGITNERLLKHNKELVIMHPGPMNRGVEIDSKIADSSQAIILDQVLNGVAVRMSVLYLLLGNNELEN